MSYEAMKRRGENSDACCYVKEASLKSLHKIKGQQHDLLEKAKL